MQAMGTYDETSDRSARRFRWLAFGGVLGPLQFTIAWLLLGHISTGYTLWDIRITSYSAIAQPISGLGMGATAPFMNAAFVALGLLLIAGAVGIFGGIPELTAGRRRIGSVLLGLPGVGAIMDGVFDLESFFLHFLGFALVLTPIVSFPVVALWLRRIPRWRRVGTWLLVAGPLTLVLAVVYFATFDPMAAGEGVGVGGLTQRILVVELLAWYVLLGWLVFIGARRHRPGVAPRRSTTEGASVEPTSVRSH
jgi:hypothetical protein